MTPDKVEEIVEQLYNKNPYRYRKMPNGDDGLDNVREALTQYHQDITNEAMAREKQLKQMHTIELDTISCMSIEQFVVWRDQRKQRLTIIKSVSEDQLTNHSLDMLEYTNNPHLKWKKDQPEKQLAYCKTCVQMTNHAEGVCLKHQQKNGYENATDEEKTKMMLQIAKEAYAEQKAMLEQEATQAERARVTEIIKSLYVDDHVRADLIERINKEV